jgi:hypothetical protein
VGHRRARMLLFDNPLSNASTGRLLPAGLPSFLSRRARMASHEGLRVVSEGSSMGPWETTSRRPVGSA